MDRITLQLHCTGYNDLRNCCSGLLDNCSALACYLKSYKCSFYTYIYVFFCASYCWIIAWHVSIAIRFAVSGMYIYSNGNFAFACVLLIVVTYSVIVNVFGIYFSLCVRLKILNKFVVAVVLMTIQMRH